MFPLEQESPTDDGGRRNAVDHMHSKYRDLTTIVKMLVGSFCFVSEWQNLLVFVCLYTKFIPVLNFLRSLNKVGRVSSMPPENGQQFMFQLIEREGLKIF